MVFEILTICLSILIGQAMWLFHKNGSQKLIGQRLIDIEARLKDIEEKNAINKGKIDDVISKMNKYMLKGLIQ